MNSTAKYNVTVLYHLSQPMPVHSLQIIYNALTFTQLYVSIFIMHIQQTARVHFYIYVHWSLLIGLFCQDYTFELNGFNTWLIFMLFNDPVSTTQVW